MKFRLIKHCETLQQHSTLRMTKTYRYWYWDLGTDAYYVSHYVMQHPYFIIIMSSSAAVLSISS